MIGPKYETRSRHNSTTEQSKKLSKAAYSGTAKRSRGICEGCGLSQATQIHHRLYRSRGGLDEMANLLHMCTGCHGVAHTAVGEARGWSVRSGFDVLLVPVFGVVDFEGHWRRQDNDGGRELLLVGDAVEYMQLIHAIKAAG